MNMNLLSRIEIFVSDLLPYKNAYYEKDEMFSVLSDQYLIEGNRMQKVQSETKNESEFFPTIEDFCLRRDFTLGLSAIWNCLQRMRPVVHFSMYALPYGSQSRAKHSIGNKKFNWRQNVQVERFVSD